eukprot:Nk52_evm45s223 gene=Nk52_evmTU45s223
MYTLNDILSVFCFSLIALFVVLKTFGFGAKKHKFIPDRFKSLAEVTNALRGAGLESSNLIIGIDYTKSNDFNGKFTFGGRSLHHIDLKDQTRMNPYQQVIKILGGTLAEFDEDQLIPTYGYGDVRTKNHSVFPIFGSKVINPLQGQRSSARPASRYNTEPSAPPMYPGVPGGEEETYHVPYTFNEVISQYNEITPLLTFSGPTSFAPIIHQAIRIVKGEDSSCCDPNTTSYEYHILIIIADGQVLDVQETVDAIREASNYPLSIVMVGVGDGPWEMMENFDDNLPDCRFDNFQFVNFHKAMQSKYPESNFAMQALMEIPDQFKEIKKQKLFSRKKNT